MAAKVLGRGLIESSVVGERLWPTEEKVKKKELKGNIFQVPRRRDYKKSLCFPDFTKVMKIKWGRFIVKSQKRTKNKRSMITVCFEVKAFRHDGGRATIPDSRNCYGPDQHPLFEFADLLSLCLPGVSLGSSPDWTSLPEIQFWSELLQKKATKCKTFQRINSLLRFWSPTSSGFFLSPQFSAWRQGELISLSFFIYRYVCVSPDFQAWRMGGG